MLSDVLPVGAVWVPIQLPVPEVLGLARLSDEARRQRTQDGFHHGQVLQVVVGLGEGRGGEGRGEEGERGRGEEGGREKEREGEGEGEGEGERERKK